MSTILKALRRLEHDKSSQAERPLREQVASAPEPKRGIPMTVAVGGVFAAGIALGAAVLLLWPHPEAVVSAGTDPAAVAAGPESGNEELESENEGLESGAETRIASATDEPPAPPVRLAPDLPKQAFESQVEVVERAAPPHEAEKVIELTAAPHDKIGPPEGVRPAAEAMKPKPRFRPPPPPRERVASTPPQAAATPSAAPPSLADAAPPRAQTASPAQRVASSAPPAPSRSAGLPPGVRVASPNRPSPPPPEERTPVAREPEVVSEASAVASTPSAIPEITPRVPNAAPAPAQPRLALPPAPEPVVVAKAAPPKAPVAISAAASQPAPPVASVQVERTHWHPLAEKRIAVVEVEGRPGPIELHEGDLVGTLVVGTIEPSGVVFLRDGVEVRRAVGAGK